MTMFSAIASSSRCSAPSYKQSHPSTSPSHYKAKRKKSFEEERKHSFEVEGTNRIDPDGAKHISEKDREVFLSYGLFNIVAGKRTAELLEKQHRHEHDEHARRESKTTEMLEKHHRHDHDDHRWGSAATRRSSEPEIIRHSLKNELLLQVPMKDSSSEKLLPTNSEGKSSSSDKKSLKRAAKTTSRNLQEFFKRF